MPASVGSAAPAELALERIEGAWIARFTAMASPCEVILDTDDRAGALALAAVAREEARRIEFKFSRYREDNIVHAINHAKGEPVALDEETARLVDYATVCHEASEGRFDITSGVLRRAWKFDGGDRVPDEATVRALLEHVDWHRVTWDGAHLTLAEGMEIDLGGLGKEYAVDRSAALLTARTDAPVLVNYGGDLIATAARRGGRSWAVGVDDPEHTGASALYRLDFERGGLATSGDARRYVTWNGRRLGHILDPRTGWPVEGAPRAVTVLAKTCLEAGTLSTLAYLSGTGARAFLEEQGVAFLIV